MPVKTSVVFGIYPDFAALRASVDTLRGCGFRNNDISVLFPERAVARDADSAVRSRNSRASLPNKASLSSADH